MISRRDFILSAAAATVIAPSVLGEKTKGADKFPAIDTHTHFYDPTRKEGIPWPGEKDQLLYKPFYPKDFRAVSKPYNVLGTVVVEASQWVEDNVWILELAKSNDDIVGLIGSLEPGRPEFAENLRRFSANPLYRGIRLRGEMNKRLWETESLADLKLLADLDLAIDIHGGVGIIETVLMISRKLPSLRIVLNHLPFEDWDGDPSAMTSGLAELERQPNVFMKVSEVVRRRDGELVLDPEFYRPGLDALFDQFGPDRLVFGSNWPVSNKLASYGQVWNVVADYFSTKSRLDAKKYFWRNSVVAYKWIPRGKAAILAGK